MLKPVNPKKVFPLGNRRSLFKTYLNPNRICSDTADRIDAISEAGDMSKAEVVRYCLEFALENADWFVAAHMKREYLGEIDG